MSCGKLSFFEKLGEIRKTSFHYRLFYVRLFGALLGNVSNWCTTSKRDENEEWEKIVACLILQKQLQKSR